MTRADRLLLAAIVLVAVVSVPVAAAVARSSDTVVLGGPDGSTRIDLARDATYRVAGLTGDVVFSVRDGVVRCVSSDCPDQVCVHSGALRPGAPIVCAPNAVLAEFRGESRGALDAISR